MAQVLILPHTHLFMKKNNVRVALHSMASTMVSLDWPDPYCSSRSRLVFFPAFDETEDHVKSLFDEESIAKHASTPFFLQENPHPN